MNPFSQAKRASLRRWASEIRISWTSNFRWSGSRGFSILELASVAALLAVMAGFAVPQLGRARENYRLTSSANLIASELTSGQTAAVARNWVYEVDLDTVNNTLQVVDPDDSSNPPRNEKSLESGITFLVVPSPAIRFYSRGHARGGTIVLQDSSGNTISIQVDNSGKVEVL